MSATRAKTVYTTAVVILSASTIAVTSGAAPLPGIHQMPTVKLTSDTSYIYGNGLQYGYDPNDVYGLENAQNQSYYDMLMQQEINQAGLNAAINGQQQSTIPDSGLSDPSDPFHSIFLALLQAEQGLLVSLQSIFGDNQFTSLLDSIVDMPFSILRSFISAADAFSASAIDPLLAGGATSDDAGLGTDLFNDALGGNPDGAITDLSAAFSDVVPAF